MSACCMLPTIEMNTNTEKCCKNFFKFEFYKKENIFVGTYSIFGENINKLAL